ncbi:MAG: Glu/Leu/Phe/Val dehydrogenase [Candidatus Abyssobacteria bacterium SURF_5]|uniref:Glutamate dehydrogenase n=1 Tax=Abyssobacteria bacterium (strain SURF_5) TaxID=2093360 RepID=A0A3A4NQL6_ABYX5|nr:MAG: Glu/Leu/Phe/Val dehydrogenase [Candidatus Abyssubacteria bacterium SURF_5]
MRKPLYRLQVHDETLKFTGYVVVDSLVNGLSAGGLRMRQGLPEREVGRLARAMTHKFAAARIPLGGAKSGIDADPRRPDKAQVIARFGELLQPILSSIYLVGEDMGTIKADILNLYRAAGLNPVAVAKRKMSAKGFTVDLPDDFDMFSDESNLEEIMTGFGIAECAEEACGRLGIQLAGATVSIQGFGTVGAGTAQFLVQKGATIVAVADINGTIYRPEGIPVEHLLKARDELGAINRAVLEFDYTKMPREDWLAVDAQILIPAAIADAIHKDNVRRISSKLVIEAANIPVTAEAEKHLQKMNVALIPDFIANAGAACGLGLILSGQCKFDPHEVLQEVAQRIRTATARVLEMSHSKKILPRKAAEKIAEEELAKIKQRF